jgi:hypothetical protein
MMRVCEARVIGATFLLAGFFLSIAKKVTKEIRPGSLTLRVSLSLMIGSAAADKIVWNDFEHAKHGPKGEPQGWGE